MKLAKEKMFLICLGVFILGIVLGSIVFSFYTKNSIHNTVIAKINDNGQVAYIQKDQEPNDTFDQATNLVPGFETMGTFGNGNSVDIYKFSIDGPATIKTALKNIPSSYDLYFYDQNKQEIASSKRSGFIQSSSEITLNESGTYYIKIIAHGISANVNAPYTILLDILPFVE